MCETIIEKIRYQMNQHEQFLKAVEEGWTPPYCQAVQINQDHEGLAHMRPCGLCDKCRSLLSRSWIARMLLEKLDGQLAFFVTLTYRELDQPLLEKRDIQRFLKRFRKYTRLKMRYCCSGEYGKKNGRKHWHLMFFLDPEQDNQRIKWAFQSRECDQCNATTPCPHHHQFPEVPLTEDGRKQTPLSFSWRHGFTKSLFISGTGEREIGYVAKYMFKDFSGGTYPPGSRPIRLMSRRPKLGSNSFRKMVKSYIAAGGVPPFPSFFRIGQYTYPVPPAFFPDMVEEWEKAGELIKIEANKKARHLRAKKDWRNLLHMQLIP